MRSLEEEILREDISKFKALYKIQRFGRHIEKEGTMRSNENDNSKTKEVGRNVLS